MTSFVCTKSYEAPPIDEKEILRYAGVRGDGAELLPLLRECLDEIKGKLVYKVCYCETDASADGGTVSLGGLTVKSNDLSRTLSGCHGAILFAATVGIAVDRLILRYTSLSPTKALFFQAIGAERIESLCDAFVAQMEQEKAKACCLLRSRFSAGYGDLPLSVQSDLFALLDPARHIGVTLNESLLMTPTKSVTAIVGYYKNLAVE
ncbi:MAG: Vitamin B12 dependent methionine synthase activation subunit [Clostridia bacterium]|nr:Vitamin B12 dependent methionine synthase activation subunit [Clostridia bacterium]